MERIVAACPSCGALAEVGKQCPFCGTTVVNSTQTIASSKVLTKNRSISAEDFAQRIMK